MPLVFVTACKKHSVPVYDSGYKARQQFNILTAWIHSDPAARGNEVGTETKENFRSFESWFVIIHV